MIISTRQSIPEAMKRIVRKRCGFGCVICGNPIIEYEHIKEYSKNREHSADNLTLLCPDHHSMVTRKLISKIVVEKHNKNPYNLNNKFTSKAYFSFVGDRVVFRIGTTSFVQDPIKNGDEFICLVVKNKKVIYFKKEDDLLLLNCVLFDQFGFPILVIQNNELIISVMSWDIEFRGRTLVIREALGKIILKIVFGETIYIEKLNMSVYGRRIYCDKHESSFGESLFRNMTLENCGVGLNIT